MHKKTKRMAVGGPVPMASRLPSGKRGEAYKSAVSGKMADAESRMAGYEAPDFKSARRAEYNADKMARRTGNAESRLAALGAKGYKKGGKVKRMAEGGLPEEAPVMNAAPITTTAAPVGYAPGKGSEGPGMEKGDREDRREDRMERREARRNRMRDRFSSFKDRMGGNLGLKGFGQMMNRIPPEIMEKYGSRINDMMSKRVGNMPKLGGELPPTTMKRGGKVKASAPKRFAKGGLVKGAGCASRGVKKARIV